MSAIVHRSAARSAISHWSGFLVFILCAGTTCCSYALAMEGQGTLLLAPVYPVLVKALDTAEYEKRPERSGLYGLLVELRRLEDLLNDRSAELPVEYERFAADFQRELKAIGDAQISTESRLESIAALRSDLELKSQFLSGFGFTKRTKSLVEVTVTTYSGQVKVDGYAVACNPWRDADRTSVLFPFLNETNNATQLIPPGRYRLLLYSGSVRVYSRDITIGLSGNEVERVTIDVSAFKKN
jgi:hypothetical protein